MQYHPVIPTDAMVKMAPLSIEIVSGHFHPLSSDIGAQISGPDAKPSTYRVVPSVPTSDPTPNSLLALLIAGAKICHSRVRARSRHQAID
jgi:hypothetical protein